MGSSFRRSRNSAALLSSSSFSRSSSRCCSSWRSVLATAILRGSLLASVYGVLGSPARRSSVRVEGWIACQEGEVLAIVGGREVAEKKKSSVQNAQYTEERSRVVLHDPVGPVRHVVVRTGLSSTTRWGQFHRPSQSWFGFVAGRASLLLGRVISAAHAVSSLE